MAHKSARCVTRAVSTVRPSNVCQVVYHRVGKHRAATWCLSVKKLLPSRPEPRPSSKKHSATAINYYHPHSSDYLIAAKQAQNSLNERHDDLRIVVTSHVPNVNYCFTEGLSANNARFKAACSAKKIADPWSSREKRFLHKSVSQTGRPILFSDKIYPTCNETKQACVFAQLPLLN